MKVLYFLIVLITLKIVAYAEPITPEKGKLINNGILDEASYEEAVLKGYKAMASYINEDGMLGYVQPIGAGPGNAWPDKTEVYGTGAFLSAGAEVYKMLVGK